MDEDLKITLEDEEGVLHDYFLVYSFDHPELDRHYTIYTDYIPDEDSNISYYAMYHDGDEEEGLQHAVEEDADWDFVNSVLEAFLGEDDDFE